MMPGWDGVGFGCPRELVVQRVPTYRMILNRSIDFRAAVLGHDLLLRANYRPEYFRRNAWDGITVHIGSAASPGTWDRRKDLWKGDISVRRAEKTHGRARETRNKMETALQATAHATIYCRVSKCMKVKNNMSEKNVRCTSID